MALNLVDDKSNVPVVNVEGDPPPDPNYPTGTFEGLVIWLADWFLTIRDTFWWIGDYCEDITFIGDTLAYPFMELGDVFDAIQRGVRSWAPTARDIDHALGGILTWEGITDKISSTFFDDKSPLDFFADSLTSFFDDQIKPTLDSLWDKATDIGTYIDNAIDNIKIPDWDSFTDSAGEWLRDQLYKILPWGDLPDVSMLDEAHAWFSTELDNNSFFQDVKDDLEWLKGDGDGILASPFDWLKERLEEALIAMLSVAGKPLAKAVGEYLNRLWDSTEDD